MDSLSGERARDGGILFIYPCSQAFAENSGEQGLPLHAIARTSSRASGETVVAIR